MPTEANRADPAPSQARGKSPPMKFKYRVEYAVFRALAAIVIALPYRAGLCLAWLVARVMFSVFRFRRAETLRRIREVFGEDMPQRDAKRIAWLSLRNLAFNGVEMFSIRKITLRDLERRIPDLKDCIAFAKKIASARGKEEGAIIGIPHMGNWDMMGSGCFLGGVPIFSVAGVQRNRLMNAYFNKLRAGHGMTILERGGGTLRQVIARLKDGEMFAILPDVRSRTPDLAIPFLGGTANLARGMATFARSADVPIIPTICMRAGWTHFKLVMHDPIYPDQAADKLADLQRMTEAVIRIIDAAIRENPGQWFWYNKRWVLEPLKNALAK